MSFSIIQFKVVREKVVKIERIVDSNSAGIFVLSTDSGHSVAKARYIILATGVQDSKPNIRNFEIFKETVRGIVLIVMGFKVPIKN